jgi:Npun R1517
MTYDAATRQINNVNVAVYECEIHLKFRLIEEKGILGDREELLQLLIEAFAEGADEYLETMQAQVKAEEISELQASPEMRRQLMRLRNSSEYAAGS